MEILQPYNNDTLQLISDNSDYTFTASDLQSGVVKVSVFTNIGLFLNSAELEKNIDYYIKDNDLFLKPNEYLDRSGFSEGNYNIQYDFLKRFIANFHISQISPSRKEIRLTAPGVSIDSNLRNHNIRFHEQKLFW